MALLYVGKGDAIDDVGNISTAYKILQELFKDPNFVNNASMVKKDDKFEFVSNLLNELANLEGDELVEKLMSPRKVPYSGRTTSVHLALKNILAELVYPDIKSSLRNVKGEIGRVHQANLDLITSTLANSGIDGVYYRANKEINGAEWGPFAELSQNSDWSITDKSGNRHNYQIHGKLDSNQFEGDLVPLLD